MLKFTAWIFFILTLCGLSLWRMIPQEEIQPDSPLSKVERKMIDEYIIERGFIEASDKSVIQTFISGSIISMAESGTYVKKGDIVATIDNSNYEDDILEYGLDLKQEKLLLDINQKKFDLIEFDEERDVIRRKEELRHAKLEYDEEMSRPKPEELKKLDIALKLAVLDHEEAEANLTRQKRLYDKGFLSKASLEPHERRLASKVEKVSEAKLNITVAKKGVPDERKVELKQNFERAKATLQRSEKDKQRRLDEQADIIKVSEQKIAEMEFKRKNLVEKSKKSICYADRDGYVIVRTYWDWRSGGGYSSYAAGVQVRERDAIIEIVSPGKMVASAIFNESDFHNLKIGQRVEMSMAAFPGKRFNGELKSLGAIGKDRNDWIEGMAGSSGVSMYNGKISFDQDVKGLQPKMSILLKIKLTKPHKGLVIPRSAVLSLDEKIWVISGGSKIEVEGRYVNEFDFEITSGLNEGDTISKFFPKDNS